MKFKDYIIEQELNELFANLIAHILNGNLSTFGFDKRENQNFVHVKKIRGIQNVDDIVDRLHDQDIEANFAVRG